MKNSEIRFNMNDLSVQARGVLRKVSMYKVFVFFLLVASLYGYLLWRINVYSNTPASSSEETAQTTPQPHIDTDTVKKIQSLQDNSVRVQSLFAPDRQNPFNE